MDSHKEASIGVAAHIHAASPGGPRYDATQSNFERSDVANGVWLCQNCARLIDSDWDRFDADLLHFWKQAAEKAAHVALRQQARSSDELDTFCRLANKMAPLLEEMAVDLHTHADELIREFVVLHRGMSFGHSHPRFVYYDDDHPNAINAAIVLQNHGFVQDITVGNWPIYRMTEPFVDLVTLLYPVAQSA